MFALVTGLLLFNIVCRMPLVGSTGHDCGHFLTCSCYIYFMQWQCIVLQARCILCTRGKIELVRKNTKGPDNALFPALSVP